MYGWVRGDLTGEGVRIWCDVTGRLKTKSQTNDL